MQDCGQVRRLVRTRSRKKAGVELDITESVAVCGTSGVSMAPTAQLADKRKSQDLEMCQLRVEVLKDKVEELTKERDYLKEQLAAALKKGDSGSTQAVYLSSSSSHDSSNEHSSDASSDSSSDTSSSEDKKKKKKKGGRNKAKKSKKMETKTRKRAQNPSQVVARYKKILRLFIRGRTMSAAFKSVGVDRNTVVVNAPIAELFIAAPSKYKELLENYSRQVKLSVFATQCATSIQEDPGIVETVKAYKVTGKLLPLKTK